MVQIIAEAHEKTGVLFFITPIDQEFGIVFRGCLAFVPVVEAQLVERGLPVLPVQDRPERAVSAAE
jgi:hypothetical protein